MTGSFDDFWEAYPNKTGIGAAKGSWNTQIFFKSANPEQIIKATKAYALKHIKTEIRFIPRPSRYLDDQTYLDPDLQEAITETETIKLDGNQELLNMIGMAKYRALFRNAQFKDSLVVMKGWEVENILNQHPDVAKALKAINLTLVKC